MDAVATLTCMQQFQALCTHRTLLQVAVLLSAALFAPLVANAGSKYTIARF